MIWFAYSYDNILLILKDLVSYILLLHLIFSLILIL